MAGQLAHFKGTERSLPGRTALRRRQAGQARPQVVGACMAAAGKGYTARSATPRGCYRQGPTTADHNSVRNEENTGHTGNQSLKALRSYGRRAKLSEISPAATLDYNRTQTIVLCFNTLVVSRLGFVTIL